jgi:hypothetical protein
MTERLLIMLEFFLSLSLCVCETFPDESFPVSYGVCGMALSLLLMPHFSVGLMFAFVF